MYWWNENGDMDVPFPKVWHGRPLLHPFGPKGPWAWRNSVGLRDFAGEGRNSVVHLHIPLPIYHGSVSCEL